LFRKFFDNDEAVYYENEETDVVWDLQVPEDGEKLE
jgi:hypothetical protein